MSGFTDSGTILQFMKNQVSIDPENEDIVSSIARISYKDLCWYLLCSVKCLVVGCLIRLKILLFVMVSSISL